MNFCKCCGKEIPEGRKFCNSSCAAKYNNKHRTRKPWTEEQKQKVRVPRVQQICRFCGKPLGYINRQALMYRNACEDCKPFVLMVDTFNRLGFTDTSLLKNYERLVSFVLELYFEKKKSLKDIYKITGLKYLQIEKIIWRSGKKLRTIAEGLQEAILQNKISPGKGAPEINFRRGYHISWNGNKHWLRSSYEFEFAKMLDKSNVCYDVESSYTRTVYVSSKDGKKHVAIPDFYLPKTNEIVEVKSTYTLKGSLEDMKKKFQAYSERGFKPRLWLDKKFVNIEEL